MWLKSLIRWDRCSRPTSGNATSVVLKIMASFLLHLYYRIYKWKTSVPNALGYHSFQNCFMIFFLKKWVNISNIKWFSLFFFFVFTNNMSLKWNNNHLTIYFLWKEILKMKGNRIFHSRLYLFCIRNISSWLFLRNCRHMRKSENWIEVLLL